MALLFQVMPSPLLLLGFFVFFFLTFLKNRIIIFVILIFFLVEIDQILRYFKVQIRLALSNGCLWLWIELFLFPSFPKGLL